jgi:serine/threonine protein phosphatase PrpC
MGGVRLTARHRSDGSRAPWRCDVGVSTHLGLARAENEDHFIIWAPRESRPLGSRGFLLAVADGMGGHAAGARASHIATHELLQAVASAPPDEPPDRVLVNAFAAANQAVLACADEQPAAHGMGTTLVAAAILGPRIIVANVGDSRCYLLRRGQLRRITEDHTVARRMIEQQQASGDEGLDPVALEASPFGHQLTRCIGVSADEEPPDLFEVGLEPGDVILLASDGLTGPVSDARVAESLDGEGSAWEIANQLILAALEMGGPDNVTAVVAVLEPLTP